MWNAFRNKVATHDRAIKRDNSAIANPLLSVARKKALATWCGTPLNLA
jgi:hypothetical protein